MSISIIQDGMGGGGGAAGVTDGNLHTVSSCKACTVTHVTAQASGTAATLLSADADREAYVICVVGANPVHFRFDGEDPVATDFVLSQGEKFSDPFCCKSPGAVVTMYCPGGTSDVAALVYHREA